jgi:predicted alpha/beta-fold hydrolase
VQPFRPLPLLGNPHVQTVLANLWPAPHLRHDSLARTIDLSDGDHVLVHDSTPPSWCPGGPVALLVHGLGGCAGSAYMTRLANGLLERAVRVVRMNLRGAGVGANLAGKLYNAACSADVRAVAMAIQSWTAGSPLALLGFSLGGNIVLKLAGESAHDPVPGLERVAAVAPPIDMELCAALIAAPRNRFYENYYVRALLRQVGRLRRNDDADGLRWPRQPSLQQFDDIYTAPRGGFADAIDYYRRSSALRFIPAIRVPTFILTARDDPFVAVAPFESLAPSPTLRIHIADQGGHMGFLGRDGAGGIRWAETRIVEWLMER